MGQRLNIEMRWGNETIANAFYHYSGYTKPAISLTEKALSALEEQGGSGTPIERAIKTLIATGAGFDTRELEEIAKITQQSIAASAVAKGTTSDIAVCSNTGILAIETNLSDVPRVLLQPARDSYCGLVSITPRGMKETRNSDEARVTVDMDDKTIHFSVYFTKFVEDWKEDWGKSQDDVDALQILPFDPEDIPFNDFCEFSSWIKNAGYEGDYKLDYEGDYILSWVC